MHDPDSGDQTKDPSHIGQSDDSAKVELRNLVTLRQFADLPAALLARSILESAGIECFLGDDNLIRMDWFWSNLLGGVKLLVRPEDSEAAERLLAEGTAGAPVAGAIEDAVQPCCPSCGAAGIAFYEINKPSTGVREPAQDVPVPLSHLRWRCSSCAREWKESAETGR